MQPVNLTQLRRAVTLALVVAGLATPVAAAQSSDHESQVAAAVGASHHAGQDLRMPDTIDAAQGPSRTRPATPAQDFRMPDTRDLAAGRGTSTAPDVLVVSVPKTVTETVAENGIDWSDVGIGAGGVIGLVLVSLGGATLVARHRRGLFPAH